MYIKKICLDRFKFGAKKTRTIARDFISALID